MDAPHGQLEGAPRNTARSVAVAALVVVLTSVLTRGVVSADAFPWWSDDPTVISVPATGLLPVASVLLSVLTVLGAAVVCPAAGALDRGPDAGARSAGRFVECGLLLAGTAGAVAHGAWIRGGSLDDLNTGLSWAAAMSAGVAAAACRRDAGLRRLVLAALLSGLVLVAAKAALQVFVEQPATVASFNANKQAVLASHGWTPGSSMARAFEHRLLQDDATAWFGLSNIVATFGAGASVMALGLLVGRRSSPELTPPRGGMAGALLATVAAVLLLVLGGSKGGYAGAVIGVVAWGAARVAGRNAWGARLARGLPLAVVVAVLAALVARWFVGERLGERSLLFRGYYLEASWRIFAQHLPWGTGPEGFRDAYMLAKNPLNPEEISSPHNVLADFACTLGLAGVAWCGLWLLWVARLGPGLLAPAAPAPDQPPNVREEIRPIFLVVCVATILGVWLEAPASTPETAAMRLVGLALALLAAAGVLARADRAGAHAAFAAGGVTLAALGLIDMTPTNPGAAAWYAMLLAGVGGTLGLPRWAAGRVHWGALPVASAALAAFAGLTRLPGVVAWQQDLHAAFDLVAGASRVRNDLDDVSRGKLKPGTAEAADALSRLNAAGLTPTMSPEALGRRIDQLTLDASQAALPRLAEAAAAQPSHGGTREAACRLELQIAALLKERGDTKGAYEAASNALALASEEGPAGRRAGPATLSWRASAIEAASRLRGDAPHLWVPRCVKVLEEAHERDPYGLQHPMRLAGLYEEFGPAGAAARWAAVVLELDGYNRMDPSGTRRLTEEQAARYRGLAGVKDPNTGRPSR